MGRSRRRSGKDPPGRTEASRRRRKRRVGSWFDLIPNRLCIFWPLNKSVLDIEEVRIAGHRSFLDPFEMESFLATHKVGPLVRKKMMGEYEDDDDGEEERDEGLEKDLEGKDLDLSGGTPFKGQTKITELWLTDMAIPGRPENDCYQVFLHEESRQILAIYFNTKNNRRHPYFPIPYWVEGLERVVVRGVGFEVMYAQACDEALLNLHIDNLKVTGNHLQVIKAGTLAEELTDQIAPGRRPCDRGPGCGYQIPSNGR